VSTSWKSLAGGALRPVLRELVRARLGGTDVRAAARTCGRLTQRGLGCTSGYWNDAGDTPQIVAREALRGIAMLARTTADGYLSLKLPALGGDDALADRILSEAARAGVRLHLDALAPPTTDAIHTWAAAAAAAAGSADLGVTLPGRWARSVPDAAWAAVHALRVRVVKGEWADPAEPDRDPHAGYLAVIEALAGRARHVSVATHDVALLGASLACLQAAGTSCDVEQLHGLPGRACRKVAREHGVAVRIYVPWGVAVLPHAVEFALARKAWLPRWFLRDALIP